MNARAAHQRGFTLVEVLIAATILFTSLVVISEAYRANMASSHRAEAVTRLLTPLPLIVGGIRQRLREDPQERVEGQGEVFEVTYRFVATTSLFLPPPSRFDPDVSDFMTYRARFRLYDVSLSLETAGFERNFIYQEMAWLPLERAE